jgi:hypothetical protein
MSGEGLKSRLAAVERRLGAPDAPPITIAVRYFASPGAGPLPPNVFLVAGVPVLLVVLQGDLGPKDREALLADLEQKFREEAARPAVEAAPAKTLPPHRERRKLPCPLCDAEQAAAEERRP